MAVSLNILLVLIISIIFSAVNSPSTDRDFKSTKNVSVPTEMVNESIIINLLRKRRETTRGHGCPIGKIFYFTGCRTFKELEDDFITTATKTGAHKTTKVTIQKDKNEEKNVDLSVVALVTPNVTTKPSTVFNESSLSGTKQTTVVTEPNLNIKPLKTVVKSKFSDAEANVIPKKVTIKVPSSLVETDPKRIVTSSTQKSKLNVGIESASVLAINTTTSTPLRVQQEPHVLESNPDLSVIPKTTFTETKTTSSISQSNIVKEPEVQKLKNIIALNNNTESVPCKEAEKTTLNVEHVSLETNQKHAGTQTPVMADLNQVVLQSTTGADQVALGTVNVTSIAAIVDTKSTVTKMKEIVTSANVEKTYKITETNSYPVPKTTPLPIETTFTEEESDSSATIGKSGRIPGSHLLEIFFSEIETLAGICAVVLLGIGVVLCIYCICGRKNNKSKECQNEEEDAERKNNKIDPSNQ